jgi:2-oxoglutarate ferredoxin oxidoreductase subunit alpha
MGLAIMTELPLVIVNSQRGGPSTGLPTKTEQSDLYQAVYGRNGDAPIPVIAARSPADCVRVRDRGLPHRGAVHDAGHAADRRLHRQRCRALEGARSEALRNPSRCKFLEEARTAGGQAALQARRASDAGAPWIKPGTPGLMHRIGGIEKQAIEHRPYRLFAARTTRR